MKKRHKPRVLAMEPICGSCVCKTQAHYSGSRRPCRAKGCTCKAWTVPTTEQFLAYRDKALAVASA